MPKQVPFDSLYIQRFFNGLHTNRNPLVQPLIHMGLRVFPAVDVLWDGQNVEVTPAATLARRPGLIKYSSASLGVNETVNTFHSFKNLSGTIKVLVDTSTEVANYTSSAVTSVFTKGTTARSYFVNIANSVYWGDGTNLKKWDGSTVTNWGITAPSVTPTLSFGAGSLSPSFGYVYGYCYKNSTTGHVSNMSPVSANTGVQTNQNITVSGQGTADAQVDKISIYRTLDGGGAYFFVADVANPGNVAFNYVDSSADSALNPAIIAPIGTNDPPVSGLINCLFHMGRAWGSKGSTVYFSGGAEITNGVSWECWPTFYTFSFPGAVTRLVSTQSGLLVFTQDDCYIIGGYDQTTFYSTLYGKKLGVNNWDSVDVDGDTIYAFTSDKTLLTFTPNSTSEIGFTIGDKLQAYNPVNVKVCVHRENSLDNALYVYNGSGEWYRYGLGERSWSPKATVNSAITCLKSIEISAASYKLLAGYSPAAAASQAWQRDTATFTDNGAAYSAFVTLGSVPLAPPGKLAHLESVLYEAQAIGSTPTVSILPDEQSGAFTNLTTVVAEPPELTASSTVIANRCYLDTTALPRVLRFLQVKLSFPTEAFKNEILGLALFGGDKFVAPESRSFGVSL